jgi:hypothetical protein
MAVRVCQLAASDRVGTLAYSTLFYLFYSLAQRFM